LCEHCHNEHHSGKLTIFGWKDTSQGRVLDFVRNKLLEKQPQEKVDHFANIQDRLKSLLGKKKKEKELLEIINAEFGLEAKIGDLRIWKKRLL
jgi:ABC-type Zn2+ transport system substrate-binding protein/surface adhesin